MHKFFSATEMQHKCVTALHIQSVIFYSWPHLCCWCNSFIFRSQLEFLLTGKQSSATGEADFAVWQPTSCMTEETVTVKERCFSSLYGLHFGCKVCKFVDNSEAAGDVPSSGRYVIHIPTWSDRTEEPKTSWQLLQNWKCSCVCNEYSLFQIMYIFLLCTSKTRWQFEII